jgi:Rieske 2Fe-2S family protein
MTLRRAGQGMTLSGRTCAPLVGNLSPEDQQRVYYYAIFPNMLLSLHGDYVMVHRLWPVSFEQTWIECEWLFHPAAASDPEFRPDDGIEFWDRTNRQDWHICELSQQGVASRAYVPGPYSPRDSISAAFDREYLKALQSGLVDNDLPDG